MQSETRVMIYSTLTAQFRDVFEERIGDVPYVCVDTESGLSPALSQFKPTVVYSAGGLPKESTYPILECASVQWLCIGGSGVEYLQGRSRKGLTVTNMAGVLSPFLGEYVIAALMMANINFPRLQRQMDNREWLPHPWTPIAGKTLCVVGLGHVGREVARQAAHIGVRVTGVRASGRDTEFVETVYTPDRLLEAVADADMIAVHAAETPGSRGLIDAAAFAAMKQGVIFLNAARGPVVDQLALTAALQKPGQIRCAVLDVFDIEPLPDNDPIWTLDNVVVTPHMADNVPDWPARMTGFFLDNLDRWKTGDPMINVIDLDKGY